MASDEAEIRATRLTKLWTLATGLAKGKFALILGTVAALNFLRLASSVLLTRMLDAHAFGVAGFITSVTIVFGMVSDLGIFAFVVRHKEADDARFLDEVWTIRLLRSFVLGTVTILLASPVAHLLAKPELTLPLACSGALFVGEGVGSMAFAVGVRHQQLGRLATMDVLAGAIQLPISIVLALWLRSYWALVFAGILGSFFKAALSYLLFEGSVRRFRFNAARMREMWSFSRYIAGSSILTMVVTQSDKMALTRLMPLNLFGYYSIATTLAAAPSALVQQYCSRVIYPYFAALWRDDPEKMRAQYYSRRRKVTLFYTFSVAMAIGFAPLIVEILYDHRYAQVGTYLAILLISPCLAMNNSIAQQVLIASGRVQHTMYMNIARCTWLLVFGIVGYFTLGTMGVVIAVGTIEVGALLYSWTVLIPARMFKAHEEFLTLAVGFAGFVIGAVLARLAFDLLGRV